MTICVQVSARLSRVRASDDSIDAQFNIRTQVSARERCTSLPTGKRTVAFVVGNLADASRTISRRVEQGRVRCVTETSVAPEELTPNHEPYRCQCEEAVGRRIST